MTVLSIKIYRALAKKCPNCGKGRVLKSYITKCQNCKICNEDFSKINADDGPAWLSLIVVGHILAPFFMMKSIYNDYSTSAIICVFLLVAISLLLAFLPIAKSVFISIIWYLRKKG